MSISGALGRRVKLDEMGDHLIYAKVHASGARGRCGKGWPVGMNESGGRDRISPWVLALVVFAGVLWTDVCIKMWAQDTLAEPAHITSWLCLAVHFNPGLFLGLIPVSAVSMPHGLFAGAAVVWLGWRMLRVASLPIGVGYALVAGGFAGNTLGRVKGGVVDFLGFGPVAEGQWVFANLADLAILAGTLLLGTMLVRRTLRPGNRRHPA